MDQFIPRHYREITIGLTIGHDAAACLIADGRLLACIEEEKLCRKKGFIGFPVQAWNYLLTHYALLPEHISHIAVGGKVYEERAASELKYWMTGKKSDQYHNYFLRLLAWGGWIPSELRHPDHNRARCEKALRAVLGCPAAQISWPGHHLCHAYSAAKAAPFVPQLTVTCDGKGDEDSFNFYLNDPDGTPVLIHSIGADHSIGQLYAVVTEWLGFRPNRHEGKVMGLAASGRPTPLTDALTGLFDRSTGELRRFPFEPFVPDERLLSFQQRFRLKTAVSAHSRRYSLKSIALKSWLDRHAGGYSRADVAYSVQQVTERVVLNEIQSVMERYLPAGGHLALAGGVFSNVVLNHKIKQLPHIGRVFVQPAMGDSGLALGAAFWAARVGYSFNHAYYGAEYQQDISQYIHSISGLYNMSQPGDIAGAVADLLAAGNIVGVYQGAMEYGPRALGHRSILAAPFDRDINRVLNQRLDRSDFMPFAPSVLEEYAPVYLENFDNEDVMADYMTTVYPVKAAWKDLLQAVVHVDGTCRPHIVKSSTDPYYHAVLSAFQQKTGCGAVVNTSFNTHEEPIVSTPEYALAALAQGRIDFLCLYDYLIGKN